MPSDFEETVQEVFNFIPFVKVKILRERSTCFCITKITKVVSKFRDRKTGEFTFQWNVYIKLDDFERANYENLDGMCVFSVGSGGRDSLFEAMSKKVPYHGMKIVFAKDKNQTLYNNFQQDKNKACGCRKEA